jgi:hypothetical protein
VTVSGQALQMLTGLPAWQVTEVPRSDNDQAFAGAADAGMDLRVQALASAYGHGRPVAFAWLRDRPGGPVRVLAAGAGLIGGDDCGQALLTLPPGSRGIALPDGEAVTALADLPCWKRIGGVTDALLADSRHNDGSGPSLESGLLSAWLDAFAWLVLAEPVGQKIINDLAAGAAHEQLQAENSSAPRSRLAARRAGARHEELRQAVMSGLWRVHLLAAGLTPDAAERVARLVCMSADLRGLPYALSPGDHCGSLSEALRAESGPRPAPRPRPTPPLRDSLGRSPLDIPMGEQWNAAAAGQWPQAGYTPGPAEAARLADDERDTPVPQSPVTGSTQLLAALARAPEREVPGLRFMLRPAFDVTPETTPAIGNGQYTAGIMAGAVLDGNRVPAGTLTLSLASLNRHVFVTGATGAGKSQTIRNLLEQAAYAGIPWMVVEPAKSEYKLMAARIPHAEVIRIRPGDLDQSAAGINPLEPAIGPDESRFALQIHADLLRELFLAAFQAEEPFPQVLASALSRCYETFGWDLVTGKPAVAGVRPVYPGLEDLQSAAIAVVDEIGYGREVRDNIRGFVTVRIGSLRLGTTGRFLDGGHPIDFAALLDRNVVLEIEDAGDERDKAFLMGAVLIRLTEHLRLRHRTEPTGEARLRHLTVIEEAHRLLRQPPPGAGSGPAAHAVEMFADLLAEVRAYGEGLIVAEQIPSKLVLDVVKNTGIKIAHRLPAADDRAVVGATMNLTDAQSRYLVTLVPGEAAVHADGMDFSVLARMPDGTSRESVLVVPASPEPVIGRRSLTCGADCQASPCTLARMRAAQRAGTAGAKITLWAELSVVAHLTGWPMPRPVASFTAELAAMDTRLRDCAISHAVDAAVASRIPAIAARVSSVALAVHVADAMRQAIITSTTGCDREEPQYLAPPFKWMRVHAVLKSASPGSGRHPRSSEWETAYCESIPGATAAAQARLIRRRYTLDQSDTRAVTTVIWGTRPRPAIEQAIGASPASSDWPARLTSALSAFTRLPWPRKLLVRPSATPERPGRR